MIPTKMLFDAVDVEGLHMDELAARVPLGLGSPADVGGAVVYLSSSAAKWVTGQTIQVAGGMTVV